MKEVLVEVFVPTINKTYDIYIPIQFPLFKIKKMIGKSVSELSMGQYAWDNEAILCNREDGSILNINLSAIELDIKDGARLMLI